MRYLIAAGLLALAGEAWLLRFVLRGPASVDPTDESAWDDEDLW